MHLIRMTYKNTLKKYYGLEAYSHIDQH